MLEQIATIFDNMQEMLKGIDKETYEQRMKEFREKYGYFFAEMTAFVEAAEDKGQAVNILADTFTEAVFVQFQVKGKIKGPKQADLNLFMIYYVFPAILLTEHENAKEIADGLCGKWGKSFKNSKIQYKTYEAIHSSFCKTLFGFVLP